MTTYAHPDLELHDIKPEEVIQIAVEILGYSVRQWPEDWVKEVLSLMGTDKEQAYTKLKALASEHSLCDEGAAVLWSYFNYARHSALQVVPTSFEEMGTHTSVSHYLVNMKGRLLQANQVNTYMATSTSSKSWLVGNDVYSTEELGQMCGQVWRVVREPFK